MNCSAVKHLKIIHYLFKRACVKLAGTKGNHSSVLLVQSLCILLLVVWRISIVAIPVKVIVMNYETVYLQHTT